MPGVPSGRGCEACRRQKKKCDEKQPTCGRCLRLKTQCIGSGQQRFKFLEDQRFTRPSHRPAKTPTKNEPLAQPKAEKKVITSFSNHTHFSPESYNQLPLIPLNPSSSTTQLANAFNQAINHATDIRYNLVWSFGAFLEDIPRRLGTSEALDRAVDVITSAHSDFCTRQHGSVRTLTKYATALRTLRVYLDDPIHAQESNTLAAVMILLISQTLMGRNNNQHWSGHAEGATQILKARKNFGPRNDFEVKIFMSLRGSVLFEGLFNHRIQLSEKEWDELAVNDYDKKKPEGRLLQRLSRAPGIMRRSKTAIQTGSDPTGVQDELWALYQACKLDVNQLKQSSIHKDLSLAQILPQGARRTWIERLLSVHYDRIYGIGLTITLFFNCMLQALRLHVDAVHADAYHFVDEIIVLAEASESLRPVGSGYLIVSLITAWAATRDTEQRRKSLEWLCEYQRDFQVEQTALLPQELRWTAEHLNLREPLYFHQSHVI